VESWHGPGHDRETDQRWDHPVSQAQKNRFGASTADLADRIITVQIGGSGVSVSRFKSRSVTRPAVSGQLFMAASG
jgi:hypothetical protein